VWNVLNKRGGKAVVAGSLELKARGILSCSGWKVRIDLMGLGCL